MSTRDPLPADVLALVDGLDSDQIRERLDALEREASALRVLCRAARARERMVRRQEAARASY
jgi:hypothetical protein